MCENWKFEKANYFGKYKATWQELGEEILGIDHPLIDIDYVEPLIKYFGTNNLLLALKGEKGKNGIIMLQRKHFNIWQCFLPSTGPFSYSLIKNSDNSTVEASIASLLRNFPGFSVLLGFTKLDPKYLTVKINTDNEKIEKIDYMETINISINRSFEDYWNKRSKNLKRNIIKKKNRMERNNIQMNFRELRMPDEIELGVEAYGHMESKGWKGKQNSAVHIDNHRGRFYVEMLRRFALRQRACIYQLLLNDKVAASALTIHNKDMVIILKITYDEDMKEFSPGMVMYYELHKRLFETKDAENIEYYGIATQRMRQWADSVRTIYHLNYFRTPFLKKAYNFLKIMKK